MLRYLPGILLVQGITAALLLIGIDRLDDPALTWSLAGLALALAVITATWFAVVARQAGASALSALEKRHLGEREKLKVNAERAKTHLTAKQHRDLERERRRLGAAANRRVALALAGAATAGALMLFTQFLGLGLVLVAGATGFGGGYLARLRQERRRNPALESPRTGP